MRRKLEGGLWILFGLCFGLVWVFADILTKNPINKLNPFNDTVLVIILAGTAVYTKWQTRKIQEKWRTRTRKRRKTKK